MKLPSLSLLCISRCDPFSMLALEHLRSLACLMDCEYVIAQDGGTLPVGLARYAVRVQSKGYLESVHDHAVALTSGDYVFRVDDDETCSLALVRWLLSKDWAQADHWAFPRMNVYGSTSKYLVNGLLWPDLQTRLSRRDLADGRDKIHCGSPHGTGRNAYASLIHHKMLKPIEERRRIADAYEAARPGAGTGVYRQFSVPEDVFPELHLADVNDGDVPAAWNSRDGWYLTPPKVTSSVPTAPSPRPSAASGSMP